MNRKIGKWHGAEHMAIAAYEKNGSTGIKNIAQESPINDKCGGRLLVPFLLETMVVEISAKLLRIGDTTIISLLAMEAVLWIEWKKGFDKIRWTNYLSRLLQKWITTRAPGDKELRTAQCALKELVDAHHNNSNVA